MQHSSESHGNLIAFMTSTLYTYQHLNREGQHGQDETSFLVEDWKDLRGKFRRKLRRKFHRKSAHFLGNFIGSVFFLGNFIHSKFTMKNIFLRKLRRKYPRKYDN